MRVLTAAVHARTVIKRATDCQFPQTVACVAAAVAEATSKLKETFRFPRKSLPGFHTGKKRENFTVKKLLRTKGMAQIR